MRFCNGGLLNNVSFTYELNLSVQWRDNPRATGFASGNVLEFHSDK